jgi:hypothetical protein
MKCTGGRFMVHVNLAVQLVRVRGYVDVDEDTEDCRLGR